jgi:hypothetical protein
VVGPSKALVDGCVQHVPLLVARTSNASRSLFGAVESKTRHVAAAALGKLTAAMSTLHKHKA